MPGLDCDSHMEIGCCILRRGRHFFAFYILSRAQQDSAMKGECVLNWVVLILALSEGAIAAVSSCATFEKPF